MKEIFDPVRRSLFKGRPEELIRQSLIYYMINSLGYHKDLFVIEKGIDQLPFVKTSLGGARRVDLLYLAKGLHSEWSLSPLLLIECKAGPLNSGALEQVRGYNHRIGATFIAIANGEEIRTVGFKKQSDSENETVLAFLPRCQELIEAAKIAL